MGGFADFYKTGILEGMIGLEFSHVVAHGYAGFFDIWIAENAVERGEILDMWKMKEINAAYDTITKERKEGKQRSSYGGNSYGGAYYGNGGSYYGNGGAYYGSQNAYGSYGAGYSGNFADVRRMISQNRIAEAEEILDGVPEYKRDAEWYYLKGCIYYKRGWLSEATKCFQRAYQAQPNNQEFAAAYRQCAYRQQYGTAGNAGGNGSFCACDPCDICTGLMCMDCLCRGC